MVATIERQELAALAVGAGWEYRAAERNDYYSRLDETVRVVLRGGTEVVSGAHYRDGILMAYASDPSAVKGWLKR